MSGSGSLVRYSVTAGQVADVTQARTLLDGLTARGVVADLAYDSNAVVALISSQHAAAVIPSRASRKEVRPVCRDDYAQRNVVERFFGRIKQFRRVATRYDKTVVSFLGFFALAAALIQVRGWA